VFGVPVDKIGELADSVVGCVPHVLVDTITILLDRHVKMEGIFRISGRKTVVDELQAKYDAGEKVDLSVVGGHDVAELLKSFFLALPEPLVPYRYYQILLDVVRANVDETIKLQNVRDIIDGMPVINRVILSHICFMAKKVSRHSDVNMMGVQNLGVIFGACLMRGEKETPQSIMADAEYIKQVLALMIAQVKVVMQEYPLQRPTSLQASGMVEDKKDHTFSKTTFKNPTFCKLCSGMIWGITGKVGVLCTVCGYTGHSKCAESAPRDCCSQFYGKKYRQKWEAAQGNAPASAESSPAAGRAAAGLQAMRAKTVAPSFLDLATSADEPAQLDQALAVYEEISQKEFCVTYRGTLRDTEVQVNKFLLECKEAEEFKGALDKLIGQWKTTHHENLLRVKAACLNPANLMFVTEFAPKGCLNDYLTAGKKDAMLTIAHRLKVMEGIVNAMAFLHSQDPPTLHYALCPDNVLLMSDFSAKVAHFGLARTFSSTNLCVGPPHYMPPEALKQQEFTAKSDVFSFGVLLHQLFTNRRPFSDYIELESYADFIEAVADKGLRMSIPPSFPPILADLVSSCWNAAPASRPSFEKILNSFLPLILSAQDDLNAMERHLRAEHKLRVDSVRRKEDIMKVKAMASTMHLTGVPAKQKKARVILVASRDDMCISTDDSPSRFARSLDLDLTASPALARTPSPSRDCRVPKRGPRGGGASPMTQRRRPADEDPAPAAGEDAAAGAGTSSALSRLRPARLTVTPNKPQHRRRNSDLPLPVHMEDGDEERASGGGGGGRAGSATAEIAASGSAAEVAASGSAAIDIAASPTGSPDMRSLEISAVKRKVVPGMLQRSPRGFSK